MAHACGADRNRNMAQRHAPAHMATVACGKSSIAYKGMLCAGKVMAASAIDLIEDPELLKAAREEFKRRAKGGYTCPIEPETVPTAL